MQTGRLAAYLVGPAVLAAGPGCHPFQHQDRSLAVTVRDAETKAPVVGAEVRVSNLLAAPPAATQVGAGATAADGTARVAVAAEQDAGLVVEAAAAGYLSEVRDLGGNPDGGADTTKPAAGVVVEVYAGPRPAVELAVPDGYRGPVRVEVRATDATPGTPGQRAFVFAVPPAGVVEVSGPPLLKHLAPPDFHARFADGTPLPPTPKDGDIGFRWVKSGEHVEYFFVGAKYECDEYRKSLAPEGVKGAGRAAGGKGGGQGGKGGGRRGGGGGGMGGR